MFDAKPCHATDRDLIDTVVTITGNGTGQPTKTFGAGVTINRTGVGAITLTWSDWPGAFVGITGQSFQAATPSQVADYSATAGTYVQAAGVTPASLPVLISNGGSAPAATDLTTTQSVTLRITFKRGDPNAIG